MSLYDKASLVFSSKAGAGKDGKAYNIKPVEKLKVDELLTNGDFSYDGDWTEGTGWSISNGKATKTAGTAANLHPSYDMNLDNNKHYKVTYTISGRTAGQIRVKLGNSGYGEYRSADGTYSEVIKPVVTTFDKLQFNTDSTFAGSIDNVSVREVEQKAVDFTMVRGSNLTATREAPSGLIEKGRENLVTMSNSFSTLQVDGGWNRTTGASDSHRTVFTSGQTGYDGSTNAWKFEAEENGADPAGSDQQTYFTKSSLSTSGVQTFSIYAKAGNVDYIRLLALTSSTDPQAVFELTGNGSVTYSNNTVATSIDKIGSDWYRCAITFDRTLSTLWINIADGDGVSPGITESVKVTDGDYIFIQNAQLEQGLVATPYIDTTDSYSKKTAGVLENEPRYDYSGGDATLLLEPERTNLIPHSEYSGDWSENFTGTLTQNTTDILSPEGVYNAFKLEDTSTAEFYSVTDDITVASGEGGEHTLSVFVKKTTGSISNYVGMQLTNTHEYVFFNTSTGSVTESADPTLTSNTSKSAESFNDNWWRLIITNTLPVGSNRIGLWPALSSNGSATSTNATGSAVFYGWQLEKGSYATSYIPTYGSAATRDDDVFVTLQDIPKVNLDKYTFFAHNESERKTSHNRGPRMAGKGNSSLMGYFGNGDLKKQFFLYDNDGGTVFSEHTFDSFTAGDDVKYAFVIDNIAMTAELFINGVSRKTASLTTRVDASRISSGNSQGDADNIKSIMYFPEALSDADAVSLTTI